MQAETLDEYLAGDYHQDMDDIRELEATLKAAQAVFIDSMEASGRWPYERRANGLTAALPGKPKVSHGTQAMIAAALGKMTGQCAMSSGDSSRLGLKPDDALGKKVDEGIKCLGDSLKADGALLSGTFGKNDPVTLSHVAELVRGLHQMNRAQEAQNLVARLTGAVARLGTIATTENPALSHTLLPEMPEFASQIVGAPAGGAVWRRPDYVINAFVPLRIVRSISSLTASGIPGLPALDGPQVEPYRKYFESTLYDQLSFSAIPDSRFDAAELIFCLEGLLLCGPQAVDERVFKHVLDVLRQKQELSAQWRPNRPVFATPQGTTMLPVSVESAVSLVRSIEIMDRAQTYHRFSTLGAGLARRFWHWLRARKVQFSGVGASNATGWHSEHVNDPGLIHLWDTSQVIEFMLAYREMLQRSVAGKTLLLSRLKVDRPPRGLPADWEARWKGKSEDFEPRTAGQNRVYIDRLTNDFVHPWGKRAPVNYSMLLYGPPGTGKSSMAENIADALGMRMVTVTVSDFLGGGGENVEARAKAIFQTLEAQFDTVILFDEIDSFLLDRDTKRYREQDSLFQFLTPGMLTKINELRKRERSIFIIATNYANRIDPAIKRRGRIDQRYLLSLPDAGKRQAIIYGLRGTAVTKKVEVANSTLFFGFADLKNLVADAKKQNNDDDSLLALLVGGEYQPATSLKSYLARNKEENFPFEELKDLVALQCETDKKFDPATLLPQDCNAEFSEQFKKELW